jgi:CheY-like chemotaxis protein
VASSGIYRVEVLGFSPAERALFASTFALSARRARQFEAFHAQGPMDCPDLYLVDADDMGAMVDLMARDPSAVRPAILIGRDAQGTEWPLIERPIRWTRLFAELDQSVESATAAKLAVAHSDRSFVGNVMPRVRKTQLDMEFGSTNLDLPANDELEDGLYQKTLDLTQLADYEAGRGPRIGPGVQSLNEGVLVVDTDPLQRQFVASRLVPFGLFVDPAESPEQALAMLDFKRYAVMVVNTALPHIDGFTLCRLIKARSGQAPGVLLVSAKGSSLDRMRARLVGCDALLSIPIDEDRLVAAVARFLPQTAEDEWVRSQVMAP